LIFHVRLFTVKYKSTKKVIKVINIGQKV